MLFLGDGLKIGFALHLPYFFPELICFLGSSLDFAFLSCLYYALLSLGMAFICFWMKPFFQRFALIYLSFSSCLDPDSIFKFLLESGKFFVFHTAHSDSIRRETCHRLVFFCKLGFSSLHFHWLNHFRQLRFGLCDFLWWHNQKVIEWRMSIWDRGIWLFPFVSFGGTFFGQGSRICTHQFFHLYKTWGCVFVKCTEDCWCNDHMFLIVGEWQILSKSTWVSFCNDLGFDFFI